MKSEKHCWIWSKYNILSNIWWESKAYYWWHLTISLFICWEPMHRHTLIKPRTFATIDTTVKTIIRNNLTVLMKTHTTFSMETQGKSALLIRTSRCCRFVYLNEFTGACSSIHSIHEEKWSYAYTIKLNLSFSYGQEGIHYTIWCRATGDGTS